MKFGWRMIPGALAAVGRVTKSLFRQERIIVPHEVWRFRMKVCEKCGEFDESSGQCLECFCIAEAKTAIASEKCPLGKWPKILTGRRKDLTSER